VTGTKYLIIYYLIDVEKYNVHLVLKTLVLCIIMSATVNTFRMLISLRRNKRLPESNIVSVKYC